MNNPQDPAFFSDPATTGAIEDCRKNWPIVIGLTKREVVEIMMLHALLSSEGFPNKYFIEVNHLGEPGYPSIYDAATKTAIHYADAYIERYNR